MPFVISCRRFMALMVLTSTLPYASVADAGESGYGYSSLAQREMLRRQDATIEGDRLLAEGREAYAKGDYQQAFDKYSQAVQRVPDAPAFADRRRSYIDHHSDAGIALSMHHRKVGKYSESRTLLEAVVAQDPNNAEAKRELSFLDDPIRTNPALTYEHTQNVDEVRRKLYTAEGNYNLGKYDDAKREYENVLRIDPYNSAARRGMERVSVAKSDYYRAAYDHTRAELLSQVDAAWELIVPAEMAQLPTASQTSREGESGVAYISEKLRRIEIPRIDFEDTTVEEAVDFLRMRSIELDSLELNPARKGVNFIVRRPQVGSLGGPDAGVEPSEGGALPTIADPNTLRISRLRLSNVPLAQVLEYICEQTKLRVKIDEFAVTLVPRSEASDELYTRNFPVPPGFADSLAQDDGGAATEDVFDPAPANSPKFSKGKPIIDLLKDAGIAFVDGATATLSKGGILIVKNTPGELDKVEQLVEESRNQQPQQVKIITKFVEVSQENTDELGFDWVVGAVGRGNAVSGAGGTIGNGMTRSADDFTGVNIGEPEGIITAGNRSGDGGLLRNSIDALLNNPNRTSQNMNVAPGILSVTGIFGDAELKMMMRGLSQRRGVDIMTAPSVTARSGKEASIEIVREFMYPTEYDPPKPGESRNNNPLGGGGGAAIVTPATPTAFETRNTGVTLTIKPEIVLNDFSVNLNLKPEIVEFEGFINYGSPIFSIGNNLLGQATSVLLTENRIEMPVFSNRSVNTELTIYDGYTVAIGGLMREDVQNIEDKVPILGDIPFVGRLFQSKAENRVKSNMIIFVTAQLIDPTGRPLRGAAADDSSLPAVAPAGNVDGAIEMGVLPPL
jgi:general secretion pathway protein D